MSDEKPADTGKVLWPEAQLGPFRYAVVDGIALELKDSRWVDEQGREYVLSLTPPTTAAHRP